MGNKKVLFSKITIKLDTSNKAKIHKSGKNNTVMSHSPFASCNIPVNTSANVHTSANGKYSDDPCSRSVCYVKLYD